MLQLNPEFVPAVNALAAEMCGWIQTIRPFWKTWTFVHEDERIEERAVPPNYCSPDAPRSVLQGLLEKLETKSEREHTLFSDFFYDLPNPFARTWWVMLTAHPSVLTLACLLVLCPERCEPAWRELVEVKE